MTRDWESAFSFWARPPSKTEEQRSENAIRAIRKAVQGSSELNQRSIKVFTQGSYRNRVNVRQDSDVDVGVMLYDFFLDEYPAGRTRADFGISDAGYSFSQFKHELEAALVDQFGRAAVKRGNKAFNIRENTYHVEADVIPLFEFRQYWESGNYRAGVALMTDQGRKIENYPERLVEHWPSTPLHYENGNSKNTDTSRRYRGLVRILKNIRSEMEDTGSASAQSIPGYLLECLCWNVPNEAFTGSTWDARVQAVLMHLWSNTKDDASCKSWFEVDAIKYLFHVSQPWTRSAANAFILEVLSSSVGAWQTWPMKRDTLNYHGYRFPPDIISHAVWLYHRFGVSFRDVEDLLAQRGITVSYEAIRLWCLTFGSVYARRLKRRQGRLGDIWHLDEVFVTIQGQRRYLWRAVDQDGDVIDILVQSRRDCRAATRFFRKLLKGQERTPGRLVTDKLRSYRAAHRAVMPSVAHRTDRYENNRAEVSHQPTRQRERQMRRFKSPGQAQRFLSVHGLVRNLFRVGRHLVRAVHHRELRGRSFLIWDAVTIAA